MDGSVPGCCWTEKEEEEGGGGGSRRLCTVTPRDEETRDRVIIGFPVPAAGSWGPEGEEEEEKRTEATAL